MLYGLGVLLNNTVELFILAGVENDLVHNIEVCLFAHRLNLRDYLSDEALFDKLGGEVRVDSNGDAVVGDREAALFLDGVYEQVVNAELYLVAVDAELQRAVFVKLLLCGGAVEGGEMLFYLAEESAVLRTDGLELRLEAVADEIRLAVNKFQFLDIELVSDSLRVLAAESLVRADKHLAQRLTVLDVRAVSCGTAEHDYIERLVHSLLKSLVNICGIRNGIIAQVDALGSGLVDTTHEVAVDILRHERYHRSGKLRDGDERGVKSHIGIYLVLAHALRPEALAAAADIPVAHLVDEVLQRTRCLGDAVIRKVIVNGGDKGVESREQPSVHGRQLLSLAKLMLRGVELVYICIEHEESVDVPERAHKLALTLDNRLTVEAVGQPGSGVGVEIPADCVCAVGVERVERVDGVALGL